jgi:hypothetical protein
MMKLSTLAKATDGGHIITMRHSKWLENNSNATYSPEAIQFAHEALTSEVGGNRARRLAFRGSDTGSCGRKRLFKYAKIKYDERVTEKQANIFHTGNFLHMKWQMAGLTEGWLAQAEVPMEIEHLMIQGTADGILYDGSGFEFKTINPRGYAGVMSYGPKSDHIYQMHAYMLMGGLDMYSIVYENKADQEWREFRVPRDETIIKNITDDLEELISSIETKTLLPMLPDCKQEKGMQFNYCPFKDVCHTYEEWPA